MTFELERKNLIQTLIKKDRIKTKEAEKAFLETPREKFLPEYLQKEAYLDCPLSIGEDQTISAPHMVAIMAEELKVKKGQKILEIGSGSGYHAAIVAKIVGDTGHVYTVERHKNLADFAKENLKNAGFENVTVIYGDGSEGLAEYAPYDRIYVTCAAPDIPKNLIEQLKDPGILLIPVGSTICRLQLVEKKENNVFYTDICGCAFVPLLGKYGHQHL